MISSTIRSPVTRSVPPILTSLWKEDTPTNVDAPPTIEFVAVRNPTVSSVPTPILNTNPSVVTVPLTVMLPHSRSARIMSPPTLRSF